MVPYIIDTTLRDGEQAPGVAFSIVEKLRIAAMLDELGVDEIEAGTPAIGKQEQEAIRELVNAGLNLKTSAWCRAIIQDIEIAARLGTNAINISLPVSDIQIKTLGKSRKWVLSELKKVLIYAKNNIAFVTLGAQDASRADNNFLNEFIYSAENYGADRIRFNDTVGILDPFETNKQLSRLVKLFPYVEFEFHGHNDFGMATANAIMALKSGIKCVSATVNGLGERAGNATLEEIVAFLSNSQTKNFNTKVIHRLSTFSAEASNLIVANNKPITGVNTFTHESGIHTSAILKNKKSYQVLNPLDYGLAEDKISFGKHSGSKSILNFFICNGLSISEMQVQTLLSKVKEFAIQNKVSVSDKALLNLYNQTVY